MVIAARQPFSGVLAWAIVASCWVACTQRATGKDEPDVTRAGREVTVGTPAEGLLPGWYVPRGAESAVDGWVSLRLNGDGRFERKREGYDMVLVTDFGMWSVLDGVVVLRGETRRQELPPADTGLAFDVEPSLRPIVVETASESSASYRPVVVDGWLYLVDPEREVGELDAETLTWCLSRRLEPAPRAARAAVDERR